MSDSEHSTVTYTSVSEEDSDIGSPGVDGPPIMPEDPYAYIMAAYEVPPSPDYLPGPEGPPSPDYVPGPEEPEQAPPSPIYIPFVPEPVYPEFLPAGAETVEGIKIKGVNVGFNLDGLCPRVMVQWVWISEVGCSI
ncbi:hypothetical protein Tco_0755277 [Tanacetum coccineum]